MALVLCPECGQSVSDKALTCPKCGYPLQEHLNSKADDVQIEVPKAEDAQIEIPEVEDAQIEIPETEDSQTEIPETEDTQLEMSETEDPQPTSCEIPAFIENPTDIQQPPTQKKSKKKLLIALIAACAVIVAVLAFALDSSFFASKMTVESIEISDWQLTDSTDDSDDYEATITSEQKSPFIALIGRYGSDTAFPKLVYLEDGTGVMQTTEDTDEDPSIKYRPVGYLTGEPVDLSDIKVKYTDGNYDDSVYYNRTTCDVKIDIDMNNTKNGILLFDIINKTTNETTRNVIVILENGKIQYTHEASLPYKSRVIEVSIVPKMFCESTAVSQEDYVTKRAYKSEREEYTYLGFYGGDEIFEFADFNDGCILYISELTGDASEKTVQGVSRGISSLRDEECMLFDYVFFDPDDFMLNPKFEFTIIGYIPWTLFENEIA